MTSIALCPFQFSPFSCCHNLVSLLLVLSISCPLHLFMTIFLKKIPSDFGSSIFSRPFLTSFFHLSYFDSLLFSSICRSQQTWDIGAQTVTQGHQPQLPWLQPLLLWPWRQSKIHSTSSLCFIPLPLAYLLIPCCPLGWLIFKRNTWSIVSQMHHC